MPLRNGRSIILISWIITLIIANIKAQSVAGLIGSHSLALAAVGESTGSMAIVFMPRSLAAENNGFSGAPPAAAGLAPMIIR